MFRLIGVAVVVAGIFFASYAVHSWYESRTPAVDTQTTPAVAVRNPERRPQTRIAGDLLHRIMPGPRVGLQDNSGGGTSLRTNAAVGAVYYSPWQNLEAIDYGAIVHSRCNHLDIAAYSFTDMKLAQAVVAFAQSGRSVRIYRDREQFEQERNRSARVSEMLRTLPNIAVRVKSSYVLMHQKAWSDGCIFREGSANFSPSGETQQDNTLTLLNDPASINNFEAAFEAMWGRSDNLVVQ